MLVLVADDDRAVREALERALQLAGYDVELASDGDAALAAIAQRTPDAVVLDVMMPGYDGLDVTRRLRREGNRVPVLLLTARDAVGDRVDGLDAGLRLSQGAGEGAPDTPLLLVTGETSPARLQRVRESQVPVLFKPVVASALLQAMAELAARKPAAEPSAMDA